MEGVHPGHAAPHRTIAICGCGALLGARPRRVRRDDYVRGEFSRRHPDDAARGLSPAGDQPGGLVHPEPCAASHFAGGVGWTQAPLAWLGVSLDAAVRLALGPLELDM